MATAGVPDSYRSLYPITVRKRLGSAAEVLVKTPADLERDRFAVRAVNASFESRPRVGLDAKRMVSEAASARTLHRAHECLHEVLVRTGTSHDDIARNMQDRTITAANVNYGFVATGVPLHADRRHGARRVGQRRG